MTALAGAVALVAGVVYSANSSFDALQAKVDGAGRAIGYTTDQLHAMAARSTPAGAKAPMRLRWQKSPAAPTSPAKELMRFTALAVDIERTVGTPVAETAKPFRELGDSPTEAVKKLSKELEFLTAAQYEQIRIVRRAGPPRPTPPAWHECLMPPSKPSVDRAGRSWRAGHGDGVLGEKKPWTWGRRGGAARAATDSQTGAERALAAQQRINEINSGLPFKSAGFVDSVRGMFNPEGVRQELLSKGARRT